MKINKLIKRFSLLAISYFCLTATHVAAENFVAVQNQSKKYAVAAITFGSTRRAFAGLLVEPSGIHSLHEDGDETWYELQWWNMGRTNENGTPIMIVEPGQIYSVEVRFDWSVRNVSGSADVSVKSLTGDKRYGRRTIYFERRPLTEIYLYNYSASNASFSSVDVRYSKRTPRDMAP